MFPQLQSEAGMSCPVCFLTLRPDITLEEHLDTHPKEKIVNAFMRMYVPRQEPGKPSTFAEELVGSQQPVQQQQQQQQQPQHALQINGGHSVQYYTQLQMQPGSKTAASVQGENTALRTIQYYSKTLPSNCRADYIECADGNFIVLEAPRQVIEINDQDKSPVMMNDKYMVAPVNVLEYSEDNYSTIDCPTKGDLGPTGFEYVISEIGDSATTKQPPKIISVAVLDPSSNINVQQLQSKSPRSVNELLAPSLEQRQEIVTNCAKSPQRQCTTPIRVSVIREVPSAGTTASTAEATVEAPLTDVPFMVEDDRSLKVSSIKSESEQMSEPSIAAPNIAPPDALERQPLSMTIKPKDAKKTPKRLTIKFKKPSSVRPEHAPLISEQHNLEPQPSTSKMDVEELPEVGPIVEPVTIEIKSEDFEEHFPDDGSAEFQLSQPIVVVASASEWSSPSSRCVTPDLKTEEDEQQLTSTLLTELGVASKEADNNGRDVKEEVITYAVLRKGDNDTSMIESLLNNSNSSLSTCSLNQSCSASGGGSSHHHHHANVNIRTDEQMPAKGEISEQESNADSEMLWPTENQSFESSRILPSYDASVARESWNFGNANSTDKLTFNGIPKIRQDGIKLESFDGFSNPQPGTSMQESLSTSTTPLAVMPGSSAIQTDSMVEMAAAAGSRKQKSRKVPKPEPPGKYTCPECQQTFRLYRQRKEHMVCQHPTKVSKKQIYTFKLSRKRRHNGSIKTEEKEANNEVSDSSDTFFAVPGSSKDGDASDRTLSQLKLMSDRGSIMKLNRFLVEFNCKALLDKDNIIPELKNLVQEYKQNRVYFCGQCHEQFRTTKAFNRHMAVHPEQCHSCDQQFRQWSKFIAHIKVHLGLHKTAMYRCTKCEKTFMTKRKLVIHGAAVHLRRTQHRCTFCSQTFMHYFRLVEHKRKMHFNRPQQKLKDYLCHCGEVFHSPAKYARHNETHDKAPKGCPFCRERFVHRNSLSQHVRLMHLDRYEAYKKDTVPCPECQKPFVPSSLKAHMALHTARRPEFKCSICGKAFSTKWNLKTHRWTHKDRTQMPFKCTLCPKTFIRANDLTAHVHTHKSIRPFTCDHCGRQFSIKHNWLRHIREHVQEKRFRCEVCGKTFHRSYYLTEHMRSHTNERPFECAICGKMSGTKTNHNKHLKIHHARDVTAAEG